MEHESTQISMSLTRRTCHCTSGYCFVHANHLLWNSAGRSRAEVTVYVRLLQRCTRGVTVSQPSPSCPLSNISTLKS